MRISDWSSDVCSSDLGLDLRRPTSAISHVTLTDKGETAILFSGERSPDHLLALAACEGVAQVSRLLVRTEHADHVIGDVQALSKIADVDFVGKLKAARIGAKLILPFARRLACLKRLSHMYHPSRSEIGRASGRE